MPSEVSSRVASSPAGEKGPLTTAGAEKFRQDWESRPEFGEWLRELVSGSRAVAR